MAALFPQPVLSLSNTISSKGDGKAPCTVYGKAIVLGNLNSGRSQLIYNLQAYRTQNPDNRGITRLSSIKDNSITVHLQEIDNFPNISVQLKLCEYIISFRSEEDDEKLLFHNAFFCIIVFNICDESSYKAVFDRWIPMQEEFAPDAYLYIVGTHLDHALDRQVPLQDICKACAKHDALYVEVSNTYGTNYPLLRRLLCQRLRDALEEKSPLSSREGSKEPSYLLPYDGDAFNEELNRLELETRQFNERISHFADELASMSESFIPDLSTISLMDENLLKFDPSQSQPGSKPVDFSNEDAMAAAQIERAVEDLKEAFDTLGLQLPSHDLFKQMKPPPPTSTTAAVATSTDLQTSKKSTAPKPSISPALKSQFIHSSSSRAKPQLPAAEISSSRASTVKSTSSLRKLNIKLPSGVMSEFIVDLDLNIEQQVEIFLLSNAMDGGSQTGKKLLQITLKMRDDFRDDLMKS